MVDRCIIRSGSNAGRYGGVPDHKGLVALGDQDPIQVQTLIGAVIGTGKVIPGIGE